MRRDACAWAPVSPRAKNWYVLTTQAVWRRISSSGVNRPRPNALNAMGAGKPSRWSAAPIRSASSSPKPFFVKVTILPSAGRSNPASMCAALMALKYGCKEPWCTLSCSCNHPRYASTTATVVGRGQAAGTPAAGNTSVQNSTNAPILPAYWFIVLLRRPAARHSAACAAPGVPGWRGASTRLLNWSSQTEAAADLRLLPRTSSAGNRAPWPSPNGPAGTRPASRRTRASRATAPRGLATMRLKASEARPPSLRPPPSAACAGRAESDPKEG
mmetsp:Transcript_31139/g.77975  ORF Transcript_31139/g.77975 Transcript_31139/m.77975 type:complete len:272 (+) Transcript_31139:635-1450(+)